VISFFPKGSVLKYDLAVGFLTFTISTHAVSGGYNEHGQEVYQAGICYFCCLG
jgi:hypothetical protein